MVYNCFEGSKGIVPKIVNVSNVLANEVVGEHSSDVAYKEGLQILNNFVLNPSVTSNVYEGTTGTVKRKTVQDSHPANVYYYR